MKKVVNIFGMLLLLFSTSVKAQEYLQIVSLEADKGANAVFSSAGIADNKKGIETDAIKSLIYTLFFQGVEGIDLLKTRSFGSKYYVDIEIKADGDKKLWEAHAIAENVHHTIEQRFPLVKHCMVHVNPA